MKKLTALMLAGAAAIALSACGEKPAEQPAPELGPDTASAAPVIPTIAADPANGDGGLTPFYDPAGPAPARAGALIRTEAQPAESSLSEAGQALRILYASTDGLDGKTPIAVSGSLFLPKGRAPADGWPLVAWAHGTVGVADVCAPSWNKRSDRDTKYLNHWLSQGYAVVASDYQGLGVARRPSLSRDAPRGLLGARFHPRRAGRAELQDRQARRPRRPEPGRRRRLRHRRPRINLRARTRHPRHGRHRHALLHRHSRACRTRPDKSRRRLLLHALHPPSREAGGPELRSRRRPHPRRQTRLRSHAHCLPHRGVGSGRTAEAQPGHRLHARPHAGSRRNTSR